MMAENMVSQAGTVHDLTAEGNRRGLENVGSFLRQRNVFYDYIDQAAEYRLQQLAPVRPILRS